MELEILGTRILSPVFGSTVYVWTSLISVTLFFLALGYWFGGKLADKGKIGINALGIVLLLIGVYIVLFPYLSKIVLFWLNDFGIIWGPLFASLVILSLPIFFLGFVAPTSVRLITKSLAEVGRQSGGIYSLAAIGSVAGTIITGFWLILYFGVTKTCLSTGLVLILFSLIVIKHKIKILSLLAAVPLLLMARQSYPAGILESFDSYYGQIRVRQYQNHLRLYIGSVPQTAVNTETKENEISYIKYFETPFVYDSNNKDVLMIGFGGGYTAKELVKKHDLNMDIVEVEPRMLDLAKKYFYWDDEAEIYFDDGRHFINNSGIYDIIIIDIGQVFPAWHLCTLEAFQQYNSHLNEQGMLMVNVFSAVEGEYSELTKTLYKTLEQSFKEVIILRNPDADLQDTQSLAILASKKEIDKNELSFLASKKIIFDKYEFDDSIKLTTDNHPIAELYDYKNWSEWGIISRGGLEYFLP